jgi:hypothetical protein
MNNPTGEGTPEQLRKWDAITREPKPATGEWTPEMVSDIVGRDFDGMCAIADAVNAAIAAERENRDIDWQLVVGALDSLGVALADHDHQWTEGERAIYEKAVEIASK